MKTFSHLESEGGWSCVNVRRGLAVWFFVQLFFFQLLCRWRALRAFIRERIGAVRWGHSSRSNSCSTLVTSQGCIKRWSAGVVHVAPCKPEWHSWLLVTVCVSLRDVWFCISSLCQWDVFCVQTFTSLRRSECLGLSCCCQFAIGFLLVSRRANFQFISVGVIPPDGRVAIVPGHVRELYLWIRRDIAKCSLVLLLEGCSLSRRYVCSCDE